MNEHLEPAFNNLLPILERVGIKNWVYGGIAIAAFTGEFFRKNNDVDVLVLSENFNIARQSILDYCQSMEGYEEKHGTKDWRQKQSIYVNGQQIFSVASIRIVNNHIEQVLGNEKVHYNPDLLEDSDRKIESFRFVTFSDENIKLMHKNYLLTRKSWPDLSTKTKVRCDTNKLFSSAEINGLINQNPMLSFLVTEQ